MKQRFDFFVISRAFPKRNIFWEASNLKWKQISDDLVAQKLSGSKYDVAADESEGLAAHKTRSKRGQAITFTMEDEASFAKCIEEFRSRSLNWVILGYRFYFFFLINFEFSLFSEIRNLYLDLLSHLLWLFWKQGKVVILNWNPSSRTTLSSTSSLEVFFS